jgi:hypothetical protein
MGGVSAAISKTAAAPIERVKLLLQNQGELVKSGRLATPYKVNKLPADISKPSDGLHFVVRVSVIVLFVSTRKKELQHFGAATSPMFSVTSQPKLLTLPSKINSSACSTK